MSLIEPALLFENEYTFPWEIIGMDRPKIGPVHSYICEALCIFMAPELRPFLRGRPSLGHLRRLGDQIPNISQIVAYCESVQQDRGSVGLKVVNFLKRDPEVRDYIGKRIDERVRSGLLIPATKFLTHEGREWLAAQKH
jgi:hypothetical protein